MTGTYSDYTAFIKLVESDKILSVHVNPQTSIITAQQRTDTGTADISCSVPWLGTGTLDPLLTRLLDSHHVSITIDPAREDTWVAAWSMAFWGLPGLICIVFFVLIYRRLSKIAKHLSPPK